MKKMKIFKQEDLKLLSRSLKYILPYKIKFILAIVCIVIGIGTGLVAPLLWGKILDNLFQKNIDGAIQNIIFSLVVELFTIIITYFQSCISASLNQNIIFDFKQKIYTTLLELPVKAYDDTDNGEFMSRLHGDTAYVTNAITETLLTSIVDIIRLITIGIAVFAISAKLALVVIIVFPVSYFISDKYGQKVRISNKQLAELNDQYFSRTGEVIWGIREVKSLGIKTSMYNSFTGFAHQLKERSIKITVLVAISQLLLSTINVIARIAVIFMGSILVINGSLSIQYFIAFCSYSNQFSNALLNISHINLSIQQVMTALERMFFLIDGMSYFPEKFGDKRMSDVNGNIKFHNVSFQYSEGENILNNITIDIPARSRTAIVGSSGSGKTTVFNLILKMYEPCKGSILIDDIDLNEIMEKDLRRYISVVRQEPFLFSMSIRENLLFANINASQQEIESACKRAYIHEFIETLPNKYDTALGENGINLSGGQRQRIAIARALLKKSKILLFDEATSSLDNESQFYIKKAIDAISRDCTVVIIAHRLSTIVESDVIYVMDKGKIAGNGNHQSLMCTNTIYKNLYQSEVDLINRTSKEVV